MKIIELKTWPEYFIAVKLGTKTFEYRKNDRDFQEDDLLILKEYNPETKEYSGHTQLVQVRKVYNGIPGLPADYCIMEIRNAKIELIKGEK